MVAGLFLFASRQRRRANAIPKVLDYLGGDDTAVFTAVPMTPG